jgi:serpin B
VASANVAQSDKPRLPAPSLQDAQVPELVTGNTQFALDLYGELLEAQVEEANLLYSPHSLSMVLGMTYAGAQGKTERQMAQVLHYTLGQARLHGAFNALDGTLADRDTGDGETAVRLRIVNGIWGQEGHGFLDSFLDTLAQNYGAGLQLVDFSRSEEARGTINGWVSDQTAGRIAELLPSGAVDGETALVLTNAVAFKAAWQHGFAKESTHDGAFSLLDGGQVRVEMMEQLAPLGYAERPGVQAVELAYAGEELSMVVLLPEAGTFEEFARELDSAELDAILGNIEPEQLRLALPKFSFEADLGLKDPLKALGMVDAFGSADFSEIDGTRELFIDEVYHSAFIDVDETGTEAAAASAVVVDRKGPAMEQEVRVDRPFLFLIRDIETGAVLFLGHVVNPVG